MIAARRESHQSTRLVALVKDLPSSTSESNSPTCRGGPRGAAAPALRRPVRRGDADAAGTGGGSGPRGARGKGDAGKDSAIDGDLLESNKEENRKD